MPRLPFKPLTEEQKRLADNNRGLAHFVALKLWGILRIRRSFNDSFDDAVCVGYEGLCRAAQRFDAARPNRHDGRPVRFSTFAVLIIRQHISRHAYRFEGPCTLPAHATTAGVRLQGRTLGQLEHCLAAPAQSDLAADAEEKGIASKALGKAMARLPEHDREILERYYLQEQTLDQLGAWLGRTRERARQVRDLAVAKLRELMAPGMPAPSPSRSDTVRNGSKGGRPKRQVNGRVRHGRDYQPSLRAAQ